MILVLDNYDSFTYNLVQYLGQCGEPVEVRRNDKITADEIVALHPDGIMLSPGPCTPESAGVCLTVLAGALPGPNIPQEHREFFRRTPIFGVCLGLQAMGLVSGAKVVQAKAVRHGKASMVRHDGKGLFEGMPNPFSAIRYHSLVVRADSLPPDFEITATAEDDGEIMGLRHRTLPIEGVQFHPESVLTEQGFRIVENFVRRVVSGK